MEMLMRPKVAGDDVCLEMKTQTAGYVLSEYQCVSGYATTPAVMVGGIR